MATHIAPKSSLSETLSPFLLRQKPRFERALSNFIQERLSLREEQLFKSIIYALKGDGKRFRPALLYLFSDSIQVKGNPDHVDRLALAVEFCHTASLIADDLPCMDDDSTRRGRPSLHVAFDEKTALLASFSLIAEAYRLLSETGSSSLLVEEASRQTGFEGTCLGQHLDLLEKETTLEEILEIHEKKTAALFSLSFTLPWIMHEQDLSLLSMVRESAFHFGRAFQILDDLQDFSEDQKREDCVNLCRIIGEEKAFYLFQKEISIFLEKTEKLLPRVHQNTNPCTNPWEQLSRLLRESLT